MHENSSCSEFSFDGIIKRYLVGHLASLFMSEVFRLTIHLTFTGNRSLKPCIFQNATKYVGLQVEAFLIPKILLVELNIVYIDVFVIFVLSNQLGEFIFILPSRMVLYFHH